MKKILLFICCALLLSGCSQKKNEYSQEKLAMYISYYNAVLENNNFEEYSRYFSVSTEVTQKEDGTWLYYIFVDTPQIAMYDVEMIVLESLEDYDSKDMVPSFGVFDDLEYNMIPYQVNSEAGYVRGIVASGDVASIDNPVFLMVTWKDITRLNQTREFLEIRLNESTIDPDTTHEAEIDESTDESDEEAEG